MGISVGNERVILRESTYIAPLVLDEDTEQDTFEESETIIIPVLSNLDALASLECGDDDESQYMPPFGYNPKMCMPEINTYATDFMVFNIKEVKDSILKMGIDPERVHDLYSDVYLSLRENELEGRGYDISCGTDVRQFVFGRIKKYSLNKKYDARYIESRSGCTLVAATPDQDEEEDRLTGFQAAYKNAASVDDIDLLESALSVKDAIETCMDFCHDTTFDIFSIFRDVESIESSIKVSRGRKGANSVFTEMRSIGNEHPEFFEAMQLALNFRSSNKELFMAILDKASKEFGSK